MRAQLGDNTSWSTAKGSFWIGGDLFYGMNGSLYRRSFDGSTFGTPKKLDPYHDAKWDSVLTGSLPEGQTYAGSTVNFYSEVPNVNAMLYDGGRLYYVLAGQGAMFWRWLNPDTGTVGAERFTVAGSTAFGSVGGMFVSDRKLYTVGRYSGNLYSRDWADGAPFDATLMSGPTKDGVDWRAANALFVGP